MSLRRLRTFVVCSAIAFSSACSSEPQLSVENVKITLGDIRTFASTTHLLCQHFGKGDLTQTFFETQVSLLADKSRTAEKDLNGKAADAEPFRARGQALARQLASTCTALEAGAGSVETAGDDAKKIAESAGALEDALKR